MTDTPLSEHVANIRTAILPYDENDWFQGCSHGGGIYMRDLWPVLDAAERSPLSDDVVEQVRDAIHAAHKDPELYAWFHADAKQCRHSMGLARAALQAARYGEMRNGLTDARNNILSLLGGFRDDMPDVAVKLFQAQAKQIDALLSSIGASQR